MIRSRVSALNQKWTTPTKAFQNGIDKHLEKQTITRTGNEDINEPNRSIVSSIKQAEPTNCVKSER